MNETVNGYRIIKSATFPRAESTRGGRVIIVHRPENKSQPYVGAVQFADDNGVFDNEWAWGDYQSEYLQCLRGFDERKVRFQATEVIQPSMS